MTPADKLAAVVAKWRNDADDCEGVLPTVSGTLRECADELQPILAELQRAQGRLTVGFDPAKPGADHTAFQCPHCFGVLFAPTPEEKTK